MNWYWIALKKYAVFSGRAQRREYWFFVLFSFLASALLLLIDNGIRKSMYGTGALSDFYGIAMMIPSTAVAVRRLHDTGHSGWWLGLYLLPLLALTGIGIRVLILQSTPPWGLIALLSLLLLIGLIVPLVFLMMEGDVGENRYGPDPKQPPAETTSAP